MAEVPASPPIKLSRYQSLYLYEELQQAKAHVAVELEVGPAGERLMRLGAVVFEIDMDEEAADA